MKRKRVNQPTPTGDATLRLERLSATPASMTWFDISASGNNGTATDAAIFSDFGFDGVADSVELGALDSSADLSSAFTVSFWYKRNITGVTGSSTLLGNRDLAPAGGWLVRDLSGGGLADFSWETSLGPTTNYGTILPGTDAAWHLASIVWTPGSPNTVTAYADGVVYQTRTSTAGYNTGQAMWIARSFYNYFYGNLDTVRVYPRALSSDEIVRDYYAGLAAHQSVVTTANLVSQYSPDGMTPTAWSDVTGSNNMTGAVTAPPAFDGDDYYTVGNPADLQLTTNWSVEAWASQSGAAPAAAFERLISKDDIASNRSFILSQRDSDGFPFAGIFVGGALKSVTGTHDYADNNWHHYMVTHDGVNLRLYVDGALEGSVATGGAMDNDPANWEIGRAQNDSSYLEGRVDTVRFYNATLTHTQILENYIAGKPAHP